MYWIINDNIEFRPAGKMLISRDNPELCVVLTTPACRCLQLLLEASPDVVTQQELFKKVWEDEGMYVPANTLYQNISIVRRGLRTTGKTDRTLIATVPRKGFQTAPGVSITRMSTKEENDASASESALNSETSSGNTSGISIQTTTVHPIPGHHRQSRLIVFFMMAAAFIAGVSALQYASYQREPYPFFSEYSFREQAQGCHYYVRDDSHNGDNNFNRIKTLITRTGLDCKKYPWVYLPLSNTAPSLVVLVCKNKYVAHSIAECITLSFREVSVEQ